MMTIYYDDDRTVCASHRLCMQIGSQAFPSSLAELPSLIQVDPNSFKAFPTGTALEALTSMKCSFPAWPEM